MRPQQKNRQRGRNAGGQHQNRSRNQNPLSRSYESNGPDLKVRGNAQQVADKYTQLARDATSAGDRVMAENYLQHAEHYNRIIITAQAEQADQQRQRDEQAQARGDRQDRRDDRQRDGRDDRRERQQRDGQRDRDDRQRDREDARADGSDEQGGRRRRRRDRDDAQRDASQENGRVEAAEQPVDASEAPQPEIGELPMMQDEASERRPRRGRRTKPAPMESDGGATTGDSDAAGDAPLGAEEGLARTVTRTRRRKAPIDKQVDKPEPAASDAAE